MIRHSTDFDGLHLVVTRNATEERPKPFSERGHDDRASFLGAKNAMIIGTHIRHRIMQSAVPSGLIQPVRFPGVKTPGYFHDVPSGRQIFYVGSPPFSAMPGYFHDVPSGRQIFYVGSPPFSATPGYFHDVPSGRQIFYVGSPPFSAMPGYFHDVPSGRGDA